MNQLWYNFYKNKDLDLTCSVTQACVTCDMTVLLPMGKQWPEPDGDTAERIMRNRGDKT